MGLIRFLLAAAVVLCHTSTILGYSPVSGNLAVQCFYIISGFYMAMVLTEKYNEPGATKQFYINRALKIYPTYWLILVLLIIWSFIVYHFRYPGTLDFYRFYARPDILSWIYFILTNLFIFGLDWTFLLGINKKGQLFFTNDFNKTKPSVYNFAFNSIAWTVGVELAFYIIAPWLNRRNLYILAIIFIASFALRYVLGSIYTDRNPWNYMFFPTQIMFFVSGILSYRFYLACVKNKSRKIIQYLGYGIFLSVILFYYQVFEDTYTKQAILFLTVVFGMPFAFELTKRSKIDRFFGNLSYPVYISQSLVIRIVSAHKFPKIIDIGFTALIVVIITALLINFVLLEPIEKYRAQRILRFQHAK